MQKRPEIIFLMGPTASGKTDLAIEIASRFPCDIISVDSAMVYRGLDIGTAKPKQDILQHFPHQLIDIRDPAEVYSAAQFCQDALGEIKASLARGRIPLLVGGTMLYFRALQQGLSPLPSADPEVRAELLEKAERLGWEALHRELTEIDPVAASRIHANDTQRLRRALEVFELTGLPLSVLCEQVGATLPYSVLAIAIAPSDRSILHDRIAKRFENMLQQGFIDEVQTLYERGDLSPVLPAIRAVGYYQAWEYLSGHCDYDTLRERGIIATRQLAKRQITWLKAWLDLHWYDSQEDKLLQKVLDCIQITML